MLERLVGDTALRRRLGAAARRRAQSRLTWDDAALFCAAIRDVAGAGDARP